MDAEAVEILGRVRGLVYSERKRFLNLLTDAIRDDIGAPVAWPDALWFVTGDNCRRALDAFSDNGMRIFGPVVTGADGPEQVLPRVPWRERIEGGHG
jgi:hypothetical protein